jgi:hypothetical protein
MIEGLALLFHITEVLGSNLSPDIDYLEFLWCPTVPPGKCWDSALK